jgi:hypothetical protein
MAAQFHAAKDRPAEQRISRNEIRRHYEQAVKDTSSFKMTEETWIGFLIGFRVYEMMANAHGVALSEADSVRCVPKSGG